MTLPPRGPGAGQPRWRKNRGKQSSGPAGSGGSSRQTFNFVLSWDTGSRGYLWSLSGGRRGNKREREGGREGLPLRRACETVGPREAAVIPIALQEAPEIPLLTHRLCSAAGAAGREVRPAERVDVLLYLGAQVLSTLEHTPRDSLILPLGRSLQREWSGLERPVGLRVGVPSLRDSWPLPCCPTLCVLAELALCTERHSAPSSWPHTEAISSLFFRTTGDRLERE